jgi:hypothetical protein
MPHPSLGELIEELHLKIKKNLHWSPHGPKDVSDVSTCVRPRPMIFFSSFCQYARSVRKWNIQPTEYTKIFCHEGCLFKKFMDHELHLRERAVGARAAPVAAPSGAPSDGALLTAEDVQNGQWLRAYSILYCL